MKNKYNKFLKAYLNVINEAEGDEIQYAILDIETQEVEQFGDDPVELMEIIDANEQDGTWEENKYGVYEREGEDGEWEISEVIGDFGGGWR